MPHATSSNFSGQLNQNGVKVGRNKAAITDAGVYNLKDATTQLLRVWVDGDNESGTFHIAADGSVTLLSSTGSVDNADTAGNLCVYNSAGTQVTIKNNLGSQKTICYETQYI